MEREAITQREISRLKKRRDELVSTACNRFEREEIFREVRWINEKLRTLHVRLGAAEPTIRPPGRHAD